jgi:hypothetical protein
MVMPSGAKMRRSRNAARVSPIARARRKIQRALAADAVQQVGGLARLAEIDAAQAHDLQHVADATGVVHQVRQGDALAEIGKRRDVIAHGVLDVEFSLRRQQQDGRAGELLADRGDAERRSRADRNAKLDVRHAGGAVQHQRVLAHHADRHAWSGGALPRRQQPIGDPLVSQ